MADKGHEPTFTVLIRTAIVPEGRVGVSNRGALPRGLGRNSGTAQSFSIFHIRNAGALITPLRFLR